MKNKKIKILFAIGRLSVGGAEKLLVKQLPIVDPDKFDPYLLTLLPEQKDSFASEVALPADHWIKMNFRSVWDIFSWIQLFNFLRKEKFDVIVTSLFYANLIVRIPAIILRAPVIVSFEQNLYPDKHRWQIWMDWFLAKWTDKIIASSEAVRKFTSDQENIPIEKFLTMHIPPLLEMQKARNSDLVRQELGIPVGAKVILTVSRLVEEKGHRYLVEAAKNVLKEFPDVYFLIVGWGDQEKSLKLQVESFLPSGDVPQGQKSMVNSQMSHVIFPGRMDIRDVLPLADIYVDPALMTDLPIAIMEAMRLGKPIVASAIGEIPVFVRDGKTGFLAEPKNAAQLAGKINHLLKNEDLRKEFGRSAEQAVRKYSLSEYQNQFENLIIDFLGR